MRDLGIGGERSAFFNRIAHLEERVRVLEAELRRIEGYEVKDNYLNGYHELKYIAHEALRGREQETESPGHSVRA